MTDNPAIPFYTDSAAEARSQITYYKNKSNQYSLLRLLLFALFIAAVSAGVMLNTFSVIAISAVLLSVAFAWLVSRQAGFDRQLNYYTDLAAVCDNEVNSIETNGNLYSNGAAFADDKHFYTADLDVFGEASLFKLMNRAATGPGNTLLAQWLKAPANATQIAVRQAAVTELAQKSNWRLQMQALLLFAQNTDGEQLPRLAQYLTTPVNVPGEQALKKYSIVSPFVMLAAVVLAIVYPHLKVVAVLVGMVHLGLVFSRAKYIKATDLITGKIGKVLDKYAAAFKTVEEADWQAAACAELSHRLKADQTSAQIKQLAVLVNRFNSRLNILVGTVLNMFFLWDVKQVIAIEEWKRGNSNRFKDAVEVIAELEALMSLASLKANYADWAMPHIVQGEGYTIVADKVAHPLIAGSRRIANTYRLNNAHKVDIITGSNMAGKSTFLRTIGINVVLALSGAPVCARAMSVSVMHLISYMRIKDSLNESTSTFKAELDRLQLLLTTVDATPNVFFLIDEMLRGTNSVDKYRGSKAVIEQLIAKNGVGMVATHDLQIARLEDKYPQYVRNYYFDIQVAGGEMLFDYKLKHGECQTFNASLLLKRIGINVQNDD